MIVVDVEPCSNLEEPLQMVFREAGEAVEIVQVRSAWGGDPRRLLWVTGWDAAAEAPCPAFAQPIDDSGDGLAWLVHGGTGGIRLAPADAEADAPWEGWSPGADGGRGEAYVVVSGPGDWRRRG